MIDDIVTKLQSDGNFAQVLRPDEINFSTIDAGGIVADLINSTVETYQLVIPKTQGLPNAVYQPFGMSRSAIDGLPVIRLDTVLLVIRHSTLSALETLTNIVEEKLLEYSSAGHAGAITIDDKAVDEEQIDDDKQYRCSYQLTVSHLAATSQSLPAVFIYPVATAAEDPYDLTGTKQIKEDSAALVIIEKSTLLNTARGYAENLIGHRVDRFSIQYTGGSLSRQDGHLSTWRETYSLRRL